ncbi:hypothetical protein ACIA8O_38655 [Kitasatospora sp. NPDC051853]|uniref:hypothetical protein n=1 Tax=Kitasatospora sp. NPDC051853 TaxID=3364058 RepID=UPI0037B3BFCD
MSTDRPTQTRRAKQIVAAGIEVAKSMLAATFCHIAARLVNAVAVLLGALHLAAFADRAKTAFRPFEAGFRPSQADLLTRLQLRRV